MKSGLGGMVLAGILAGVGWPQTTRADAVDEAFSRGNQAAAQMQWQEAIAHYGEAEQLLPEPSAVLAYNLGTAYAQASDLGRATVQLRRAQRLDDGSVPELAEGIRHNLSEVRRRAEIQAAASGAQIDRPRSWQDVLARGLGAPATGWVALASGVALVVVLGLMAYRRRRAAPGWNPGPLGALLVLLGLLYLGFGLAHGLVLHSETARPRAIVVGQEVEAHEGPGLHRPVEFAVQPGSEVRVVERAPGWRKLRLPGGLAGWVEQEQLELLGWQPGS